MFAARSQFFAQPAGGGFGNNAFFPGNAGQFISKAGTTNLVTWKATTGYTVEYWGYWTSFSNSIQGGPGNQDGAGTNYNRILLLGSWNYLYKNSRGSSAIKHMDKYCGSNDDCWIKYNYYFVC